MPTTLLKFSKFQNEFMNSSFLPKHERKIVRISALLSDFINSFRNLLTFRRGKGQIISKGIFGILGFFQKTNARFRFRF